MDNQQGKVVDFFGVGPQRTASSWLHEVLSEHPQIGLPEGVKETMFFDLHYAKGMDWYLWHFRNRDLRLIRGEIGPTYFDCPDVARRIAIAFPQAKIIINVRNPIEQSYSLFRHHRSKGRVGPDFYQAAQKIPRILSAAHYEKHCAPWEQLFPDQLMYVIQDDIKVRPQSVLDNVTDFLGLSRQSLPQIGTTTVNAADAPRWPLLAKVLSSSATIMRGLRMHRMVELGKRMGIKAAFRGGSSLKTIDDECFAFLLNHFHTDIVWLEQKFGRDFSAWRINSSLKSS